MNSQRLSAIHDMIDHCNFIDLGFSGPMFTWNNGRHGRGLIKERLDRVISNGNWRAIYPDSMLFHIPRTQSDHCLLLLDLDALNSPAKKMFRLEKFWLSHPEFEC